MAICSIWSTLLMFHTDIHTDGTPTHASTTAHTHTDEDESPFPASSQSPWRCLFTLHCDSFVCVCVCVCRSEEGDIACQVLSRAKLSFLSVITPSYFPGAGCLSFCLSLYNTHTLSLSLLLTPSLTHSQTQAGGAPDSVSPVRRAVREETRVT